MNKTIIFDFNRTLYDPDQEQLLPDAIDVVAALKTRGYTLHLISRGKEGRAKKISALPIYSYFDSVIVTDEKKLDDFKELFKNSEENFVIGDRIKREIYLGNCVGATTIWIKNGKFANELPSSKDEEPTYTVASPAEILSLLL